MAIDFDAHITGESAAFLRAIEAAGPDARVPSCPDWSAADLLWHLGTVQHFWAIDVAERRQTVDDYVEPRRPGSFDEELAFFRGALQRLLDALAGAPDDDEPVWSWFEANQTVGFVRRRQAHEALIHRVDAELAAGEVTAIDTALASDGVLEAIEWQFGPPPSWAVVADGGPIGRVTATDTGASCLAQVRRWSGTSPTTGTSYADESALAVVDHGPSAFAIEGAAADLDRWIWNRGPSDPLSFDGDTMPFVDVIRAGVD